MRTRLAAGNWKMNGMQASLRELRELAEAHSSPGCSVLICPPATLIAAAADLLKGSAISIGAQDCHAAASGAHTGDLSAPMLADAGATHVILGHSERRADHGETDEDVQAKVVAAAEAGLVPIVCVGETLAQREAGDTLAVIAAQLAGSLPDAVPDGLVVAYEPVWAIGTGRVADTGQIAEVHDAMRATLATRYGPERAEAIPLLYGGSVKPGNAAEIFATSNVDGALVGGASLTAPDFSPIVTALGAAG